MFHFCGRRGGDAVNIYDIAELAGVSIATVSRVLNDLSLIHI